MQTRRNEYDVTNQVKTTDSIAVSNEVCKIYQELYPDPNPDVLSQAFADLTRLYAGKYPGYMSCETSYHDIQHVLDVTLAMARLMDGYEHAAHGTERFGERLFRLGIITALFHDCGYIRHRNDTKHQNGAEYTLVHVSRGASFLEEYLPKVGMPDLAGVAAQLVHFTGYEIPVQQIRVPSLVFRLLGNLLGSADIVAQMADRCYLEKCHERLYPEFVLGGIARRRKSDGSEEVVFESADDLVLKTPNFYRSATKRMDETLGGAYRYVQRHFGGQNLYLEEMERNVRFARIIGENRDMSLLRRKLPVSNLGSAPTRSDESERTQALHVATPEFMAPA
ncbi:MAG TPA: hypothetical protein VEG25_07580 [Burkholderiales bacterium]|nr:hypothetical protein [Burkholderiales bacterium]